MGYKTKYETDIKTKIEEKLTKIKANGGLNILEMKSVFMIRPPTPHELILRKKRDPDLEQVEYMGKYYDDEEGKVLPWKNAIQIVNEMKLPVYINDGGQYQCHFRDVIKYLTRRLLEDNDPPDFEEIEENPSFPKNKDSKKAEKI